MKTIHTRFAEILNDTNAAIASELMRKITAVHKIDQINWYDEFPECPDSSFRIARSNDAFYIKFCIVENNIRALHLQDHEPVWEDSCVEFFCQKPQSDTYMNFEFNCIGTCLATSRKGRNEDVVPFTTEQMQQIERFPTLERKIYNDVDGLTRWELTVKIPFSILGLSPAALPEYLNVNFYKCGDGTQTPHYLSWNPISTPMPDFHCPEHFGKLVL